MENKKSALQKFIYPLKCASNHVFGLVPHRKQRSLALCGSTQKVILFDCAPGKVYIASIDTDPIRTAASESGLFLIAENRKMQQHYEQWTATTLFVCPLYLLTIIVGSLGNGMVIYSYATDKTIHRTFNFLITNLAIADLILSLLFTPLLFIYRVHAKSELISFTPMCEISIFLSMLSISMMYLVFPLLAYHRKDVMLRPQQPKLNLAQARLVVYMFWILSAIAAVMMILMARREFSSDDSIPKLFRCLLINQDLDKYAQAFLLYSASLYGLSIAISAVLYFMIFRQLGQHLEGVNGSAEERHCTKLCFWVAIVYTAFWTPFLLVQLGGVFGKYSEVHFNLHGCSSAIGVIGSAVNPLLYAIMNPYYKEKLYCLYKRVTCRG